MATVTNHRPTTLAELCEAEPSLAALFEAAEKITPAGQPRPSALTFFTVAARRILQSRPLLHGPATERLVIDRLRDLLGCEEWVP